MGVKTLRYGNVSDSFSNLATEIAGNVLAGMENMPKEYPLRIFGSNDDFKRFMREYVKVIEKRTGCVVGGEVSNSAIRTSRYFDLPETMIVQDDVLSVTKDLEHLEGAIAHDIGHGEDYWKNNKITLSERSGVPALAEYISNEYCAERNAIEAGYYPGILAMQDFTIRCLKANPQLSNLLYDLNADVCHWAFLQSPKPNSVQKNHVENLWDGYVKTKPPGAYRDLLASHMGHNVMQSQQKLEKVLTDRLKNITLRV
jgi:hypothetical protein